MNVIFKIVEYLSDDYKKAVLLREEILRKPLGLSFSAGELAEEKVHVHIAGFLEKELCVTASLVPEGHVMRMQRVAVKNELQGKGLGTQLLKFCESYAKQNHIQSIYCYARQTAIPFYLKNHYIVEGNPTERDGIPHQKMRKILK